MEVKTLNTCTCYLCTKSNTDTKMKEVKATTLCLWILKSLKQLNPDQEFFSFRFDVCNFVDLHSCVLKELTSKSRKTWKKNLLDALNRSDRVENGKDNFLGRGYYRLKKSNSSEESLSSIVLPQSPTHIKEVGKVVVKEQEEKEIIKNTMIHNYDELVMSCYQSSLLAQSLCQSTKADHCTFGMANITLGSFNRAHHMRNVVFDL
ncbi:hypothetical protein EIN_085020 [Entamoeba invadens IP1]|uniref:hypothetical protein n=1 Tax=Entamoeba invadens IP1 TaxID=370355 RepID=UPI0002C3CF86|nr:hypothetical protein EIN_085020 [Entamoeba invadens IP1]ELP85290.1 hypothetical protein EIN_085020 [Entamoeba invadens IP1]|eukprot:XP_004184636.1 hypothetical protein EIN_085020 [Entamoeba invadens IP1]